MPPLQPGDVVRVRGDLWRLARLDAFDRCRVLTLDPHGGAAARRRFCVIEPFDRPAPLQPDRPARRSRRAVLRTALDALSQSRPARGLWTAADAAIDLFPYQLEPALAVLAGATRVLLADAVGLGKTVQAGLILSELRARGWVDRALIVCPAGLRAAWRAELARFGIDAAVLDYAAITEQMAALPPGVNPWSGHACVITSIDYVKRPDVLAALVDLPIDVLIADEAHHLTPGTDRAAAVAQLAERTPWCVFATATPHSGDVAAFDGLMRLGGHGEPIAVFRRTRGMVGLRTPRRRRLVRVRPHDDEAIFLDAVEQYVRDIWNGRGAVDPSAQLVAITLARRAASSTAAVIRTLRRRLAALGHAAEPSQPALPWDQVDDGDGSGDPALLSVAGLADARDERDTIARLLTLAEACGPGAKVRWLLRFLARIGEPALIFTEYRDTLDALVTALHDRWRVGAISGVMSPDERRAAIDAFNDGRLDRLVATDAAGEGLNLHHRCRLVIDLELPWNPLRIEQRIGRVDRIGQARPVHAVSLYHDTSIEARVLDRLRLRQRRAGLEDPWTPLGELTVARAVFDGHAIDARPWPSPAGTTVRGAHDEADRAERERRIRRSLHTPRHASAWCAPARPVTATLAVVHRISVANAAGELLLDEARAHIAGVRRPSSSRDWRRVIEAALASPTLLGAVDRDAAELRANAARDLAPLRTALRARLDAIRHHLQQRRPHAVQHSLFDRRAAAATAHDQRATQRLDAAIERRLAGLDAPIPESGTTTRMVAAWPLDEP